MYDFVINGLGISINELKLLVNKLVDNGFMEYTADGELKLTEKGINLIESRC